ncbi:hypothetical protein L2E82_35128 [Cichorium intybus]|uniref:Uncharacterized protein n=1 Tax=Cichorium intybus TaxID=13427 RepID=A0ACB9BNE4_CICIN|nr:hypothetical protein L2E82_35128 [Cichorium intybus]
MNLTRDGKRRRREVKHQHFRETLEIEESHGRKEGVKTVILNGGLRRKNFSFADAVKRDRRFLYDGPLQEKKDTRIERNEENLKPTNINPQDLKKMITVEEDLEWKNRLKSKLIMDVIESSGSRAEEISPEEDDTISSSSDESLEDSSDEEFEESFDESIIRESSPEKNTNNDEVESCGLNHEKITNNDEVESCGLNVPDKNQKGDIPENENFQDSGIGQIEAHLNNIDAPGDKQENENVQDSRENEKVQNSENGLMKAQLNKIDISEDTRENENAQDSENRQFKAQSNNFNISDITPMDAIGPIQQNEKKW